ncbi:GDP-mannose-dependent alpha-(1-6)-phosphatidylinositol monomannoside mannosyltransferase [Dermatophilus congolensis]|uniref:GDP-mannose-dependent alpha-(1-6)-phosphatidylinositol monomannoside mannosyltransferase n=1 Tax=Dermatophilus congolensis TaxID=1863 RepID=A0AA46BNZ2_9MICO|nr:glycosyltransferase family 4 protein [Dermatophilus congolensis]STD11176.1 GDP-mannose-dependent alpha-(1-6)-phosphatidylinositol monomannoside mannosyltransferase [Dermatophilus congolensis]
MKILVVAVNYDPEPTGIAPYVAGLARGLRAQGHDARVITGIPHYPQWRNYTGFRRWRRDEVIDGVPVRRVRHVVPAGGIGVGRILLELSFAAGVLGSSWGRPDVVLTVSPPLLASAAVVAKAKLLGVPSALWSQDLYTRGMAELDAAGSWKVRVAKGLEGAVYRAADGVVAIGERFRTFAVSELGVPAERVSVHGNWSHVQAASSQDGQRFRERMGWGDRPVFMHSGAMGNKQGLEVVVEAAKVAQSRQSRALFVLTGDGSERARLEELAGDCANISFVDPLPDEDFRAALAAADVLVLNEKPGVAEMAVPSKLSTYFNAGKPVVAAVYALGTAAGLVERAGAGVVVVPGAAADLLEAAEGLVADPARAAELGVAGREFAQSHLGEGAAVRGIMQYLASVAGVRLSDQADVAAVDADASAQATQSSEGTDKAVSRS